jgi:small subunit ribosomal protein S5
MIESKKITRRNFKNVEFVERLLMVNRVTKVVKGGRIMSFSAFVVIGNKNGYFGVGMGKALEVSEARKKATRNAKNNLYYICMTKARTIPHEVSGKYCASKVIIRAAKPGTGVIAGGAMRAIFECLGIKDIVAKSFGSSNRYNVVKATINAMLKIKSKKYFDIIKNSNNAVNKMENKNNKKIEVVKSDNVVELADNN